MEVSLMKEFRKFIDSLPLIWRIILALPLLDGIVYGIYRICKGNTPNVILGIIWIFAGSAITWVVDLVFLLLGKKIFEL